MGSDFAPKPNGPAAGWPETVLQARTWVAWALGFVSLAFALSSAWPVFFSDTAPWSTTWIGAWMSLLLFSLCAKAWFSQALASGPIVTIGPQGVRDTRISPDWIPWDAIAGLSVASAAGNPLRHVATRP